MRLIQLVVIALLLAGVPKGLIAATPTTLPDTHQYVVHSEQIDQAFEINVWRSHPERDAPTPVVYVTDGLFLFSLLQSTVRMMQLTGELPPMTLVGIGYASDMSIGQVLATRRRELTPTADVGDRAAQVESGFLPSNAPSGGGATAFLTFIEQQVKPLVYANYSVNREDETLVGHSLGGLFALYALLEHGDFYDRYLASSPSLWWDAKHLFELEQASRKERHELKGRVFVSVGQHEGDGERYNMVGHMHAFASLLQSGAYPKLHVVAHEFPDETHQSVIPAAYSRGMRSLFADGD